MNEDLQPTLFPLDAVKRYQYLDPDYNAQRAKLFERALSQDLTDYYLIDVISKVSTDQHCIITFKGQTGSGKSYGGLITALLIAAITDAEIFPQWVYELNIGTFEKGYVDGKEEDKEKLLQAFKKGEFPIGFNRTQLKKSIKFKVAQGKFIGAIFILDERPKTSEVGQGAKREKYQISDFQDEMRSLRASFIRISPTLEEGENPHIVVEALREFDKTQNKSRDFIYFVRDDVVDTFPSGYIWLDKPPDNLLNIYEFLKKNNQTAKLEGQPLGRIEELEKAAQNIMKTPDWKILTGARMKQIRIRQVYEGQFTTEEMKDIFAMTKRYQEIEDFGEEEENNFNRSPRINIPSTNEKKETIESNIPSPISQPPKPIVKEKTPAEKLAEMPEWMRKGVLAAQAKYKEILANKKKEETLT